MVQVNKKALEEAANTLRDLKNWITVIQNEYGVTEADAKKTKRMMNKIGRLLAL